MLFIEPFFLFVYLPIFGALYLSIHYIHPKSLPLLFSTAGCAFVFYCGIIDGTVFIISIMCNYIFLSLLKGRMLIFFSIIFNLGLLVYYKYSIFILSNLGVNFTNNFLSTAIPLGISFYTFHQIAFACDISKEKSYEMPSIKDYFAFVGFFPQLIAGPIVRAHQFFTQFKIENYHIKPSFDIFLTGITIFLIGAFKKLIIADGIAPIVNDLFTLVKKGTEISILDAWLATIGFSVQILFDFSGYSEMAIGLGLMFGIVLPFNFNSPYRSSNIQDFWRRWHVTLSQFFRDYLYIALGGNRGKSSRTFFNLFIVMTVCGFWHGSGWNFIAWGTIHGTGMIFYHVFSPTMAWLRVYRLYRLFSWAITLLFIMLAWVMFRSETINDSLLMYKHLSPGVYSLVCSSLTLFTDFMSNINFSCYWKIFKFTFLQPTCLTPDIKHTLYALFRIIAINCSNYIHAFYYSFNFATYQMIVNIPTYLSTIFFLNYVNPHHPQTSIHVFQYWTIILLTLFGMCIDLFIPSIPTLIKLDKINFDFSSPLKQIICFDFTNPRKMIFIGVALFFLLANILTSSYQPFIYFRF